VSTGTHDKQQRFLEGRRVALAGKFSGMPRRDVERLVRHHGGTVVPQVDTQTELLIVGDDSPDGEPFAAVKAARGDSVPRGQEDEPLEVLRESELWTRLGLVDEGRDVKRLYTPAMLAELVRVPARVVRHWHRRGHLEAERSIGRLPYFQFAQVRIAQRLSELLVAGCSLSQIDRKLDELRRLRTDEWQPLADAAVVVVGRRLYVRRGEQLAEPSGQLLIDFDAPRPPAEQDELDAPAATIPFEAARPAADAGLAFENDDLRSLADDFEQSGDSERAIEIYRSILMSGDFTAEDHFSLAELLYRHGELPAARERYYAAIELDENYVEARANLGCLLAEQGELALAEAAFRGALEYHPDFADAHFHLARLLDAQNDPRAASHHWQRFLDLAPASPWAEEALDRTGAALSP
jgi:tetratricopeptide (TPR) repeat protein